MHGLCLSYRGCKVAGQDEGHTNLRTRLHVSGWAKDHAACWRGCQRNRNASHAALSARSPWSHVLLDGRAGRHAVGAALCAGGGMCHSSVMSRDHSVLSHMSRNAHQDVHALIEFVKVLVQGLCVQGLAVCAQMFCRDLQSQSCFVCACIE